MQRIRSAMSWAILVSETSHVFCCVIPSIVSLLSLLTGMGLMSALPVGLLGFHEFMHAYEVPMIAVSGIILAAGWGLHALSQRLDCRGTGCCHEPCAPKKSKDSKMLRFATVLYAVNLLVYFMFHYHAA